MTKLIVNVQTGETIETELSEEELAQQLKDKNLFEKEEAEAKARVAARQAILDRLGLTEDEAKILLG